MKPKKIRRGKYEYGDWFLTCVGYHSPDRSLVWEAVNKHTGCADAHAYTLRHLKQLVDSFIN